MPNITAEQVRTRVRDFWNIWTSKAEGKLEGLYFPTATVFSGTAKRTEPARLAVTRRIRQFFGPEVSMQVEVSLVEVQLVENVAIASYTYRFRGNRKKSDGSTVEMNALYGRVTQVFRLDEQGELRIFHEHFSNGEPPKVEKNSSKDELRFG
jgi:ketosteroid isomerase-like protein